jgi:hypothetical protein
MEGRGALGWLNETALTPPPCRPPRPRRLPPALAQLLKTPYETRTGAAKALDALMQEQGMTAPGNPQRLAPTGAVAAALGRKAGAEFDRGDLLDVVAGVLDPMEPMVLTHEVE